MKKFLLTLFILIFSVVSAWAGFVMYPKFQAFDSNGDPLASGKVYTYDPGTTDAKTTYSDYNLATANANPVVLDSRGEADIYCSGSVKLVVKNSAGTTIFTVDNFPVVNTTLIQDTDTDTMIQTEESSDEDTIRFDIGGTEQVIIDDGTITPTTDNDIDLGTSSKYFKTGYINVVYGAPPGYVQRANFSHSSDTAITIGPGRYHVDGTTDQTVYWNSTITFNLGKVANGGSNDGSADIDAGAWAVHYIYLDDSAIVTQASPLLDADCFLNTDVTAPTWSATKHGWYNGSDRCIFAVTTDADDDILVFWHDGGDYVFYDAPIHDYSAADPADDWSTEVTLDIPAFCSKANCWFKLHYVSANSNATWRNTDSSDSDGQQVGYVTAGADEATNTVDVFCNSSLKIDIKVTGADPTLAVDTNGWYFPNGM